MEEPESRADSSHENQEADSSSAASTKPARRRRLAHRRQYAKSRRIASSFLRSQFVRYDTLTCNNLDSFDTTNNAATTTTTTSQESADNSRWAQIFDDTAGGQTQATSATFQAGAGAQRERSATIAAAETAIPLAVSRIPPTHSLDYSTPSTRKTSYFSSGEQQQQQRKTTSQQTRLLPASGDSNQPPMRPFPLQEAHNSSFGTPGKYQQQQHDIYFTGYSSSSLDSNSLIDNDHQVAIVGKGRKTEGKRGGGGGALSSPILAPTAKSLSFLANLAENESQALARGRQSGSQMMGGVGVLSDIRHKQAQRGNERVVRSETVDLQRVRWSSESPKSKFFAHPGLIGTLQQHQQQQAGATAATTSAPNESNATARVREFSRSGRDESSLISLNRSADLPIQLLRPSRQKETSPDCIDNVHFNDLFHGPVTDSSSVTINQSVRYFQQQQQQQQQQHQSSTRDSLCAFANSSMNSLSTSAAAAAAAAATGVSANGGGQCVSTPGDQQQAVGGNTEEQQSEQRSELLSATSSKQQQTQGTCSANDKTATTSSQATRLPTDQTNQQLQKPPLVPPRSPGAADLTAKLNAAQLDQNSKFLLAPNPNQHSKRRSTISALTPITGSTSSSLANLTCIYNKSGPGGSGGASLAGQPSSTGNLDSTLSGLDTQTLQPMTPNAAVFSSQDDVELTLRLSGEDLDYDIDDDEFANSDDKSRRASHSSVSPSATTTRLPAISPLDRGRSSSMTQTVLLVTDGSRSPRTNLDVPNSRQVRASSLTHVADVQLINSLARRESSITSAGNEHWRLSYKRTTQGASKTIGTLGGGNTVASTMIGACYRTSGATASATSTPRPIDYLSASNTGNHLVTSNQRRASSSDANVTFHVTLEPPPLEPAASSRASDDDESRVMDTLSAAYHCPSVPPSTPIEMEADGRAIGSRDDVNEDNQSNGIPQTNDCDKDDHKKGSIPANNVDRSEKQTDGASLNASSNLQSNSNRKHHRQHRKDGTYSNSGKRNDKLGSTNSGSSLVASSSSSPLSSDDDDDDDDDGSGQGTKSVLTSHSESGLIQTSSSSSTSSLVDSESTSGLCNALNQKLTSLSTPLAAEVTTAILKTSSRHHQHELQVPKGSSKQKNRAQSEKSSRQTSTKKSSGDKANDCLTRHRFVLKEIELTEAKILDCDTSGDDDKVLTSSYDETSDKSGADSEDDKSKFEEEEDNGGGGGDDEDDNSFQLLTRLNSVHLKGNKHSSCDETAESGSNDDDSPDAHNKVVRTQNKKLKQKSKKKKKRDQQEQLITKESGLALDSGRDSQVKNEKSATINAVSDMNHTNNKGDNIISSAPVTIERSKPAAAAAAVKAPVPIPKRKVSLTSDQQHTQTGEAIQQAEATKARAATVQAPNKSETMAPLPANRKKEEAQAADIDGQQQQQQRQSASQSPIKIPKESSAGSPADATAAAGSIQRSWASTNTVGLQSITPSSRMTTPRSSFQHYTSDTLVGGASKAGVIVSSSTPRVSSRRSSTASAASAFAAATAASNNPLLTQPPRSIKANTGLGLATGQVLNVHQRKLSADFRNHNFAGDQSTGGGAHECLCANFHRGSVSSTATVANIGTNQAQRTGQTAGHRPSDLLSGNRLGSSAQQHQHYHHPSCIYFQQSLACAGPTGSPSHTPLNSYPNPHSDASSLCNSRASSRLSSCAGLEYSSYSSAAQVNFYSMNQHQQFVANMNNSNHQFVSTNTASPIHSSSSSMKATTVQGSQQTPVRGPPLPSAAPTVGGNRGANNSNSNSNNNFCQQQLQQSLSSSSNPTIRSKRNSTQINIRSVATIRVLSVLRHWVSKHSQDFVNDTKLSYLVQEFLQDLIMDMNLLPAEHKAALQLQQMVQKAAHSRSSQVDLDLLLAAPARPSPDSIETLSALEIAEGMTYLDHKIFLAIRSEEFLGQAWMKMDKAIKAPHILLITKRFNDVSRLVSSEIIRVPELHRRVAIIEKWTNVAHICRVVHNFNGVLQICAAFTNSAVFRLKKTWDKIPKTTKTTIDQLQNLVSTDSRFRNMRDAINRCDPPSIPYVGMYLTDLSFIEEGTPNYSPDGLLNFSKMRMIAHVIREIQHLQNGNYKIELNHRVANYLLDASRHLQDDEMYRCSLAIEPRSSGSKNGVQILNSVSNQYNNGTNSSGSQHQGPPVSAVSATTTPLNQPSGQSRHN